MRATEVAYQILKERGHPLEVHDLLDEVLAAMGLDREPRKVAQIYTELNMDIRFVCRGATEWGLKEWSSHGAARGAVRDRVSHDADEAEETDDEENWQ